jgi:hypothetical protein
MKAAVIKDEFSTGQLGRIYLIEYRRTFRRMIRGVSHGLKIREELLGV